MQMKFNRIAELLVANEIRLLLTKFRLLVADELVELQNELVEVLVQDFKRTTHLFRGM